MAGSLGGLGGRAPRFDGAFYAPPFRRRQEKFSKKAPPGGRGAGRMSLDTIVILEADVVGALHCALIGATRRGADVGALGDGLDLEGIAERRVALERVKLSEAGHCDVHPGGILGDLDRHVAAVDTLLDDAAVAAEAGRGCRPLDQSGEFAGDLDEGHVLAEMAAHAQPEDGACRFAGEFLGALERAATPAPQALWMVDEGGDGAGELEGEGGGEVAKGGVGVHHGGLLGGG